MESGDYEINGEEHVTVSGEPWKMIDYHEHADDFPKRRNHVFEEVCH